MTTQIKIYGKIEEISNDKVWVWEAGIEGSDKKFAIKFTPKSYYQDGEYTSSAWIVEEYTKNSEPFRSFKHKVFTHPTSKSFPTKMVKWMKR